jgi:arylsulfatase A-like enzyme
MTKPNILFLLVDCLRADAVYGRDRKARTPTIDRLVRSGVAFTQAIASASSTTPCVGSLLTATYSFVHGLRSIFGLKLNPTVTSLVEVLAAHGYETHAGVSGPLFPETGLNRGFSSYCFREASAYLSSPWGGELRRKVKGELRPPWFLLLHLWELHHPRHSLPQFRSWAYGRNRYERALSSLDYELGKLLEVVPTDTLIVLHGDHGERVVKTDFYYRLYRLARDLFSQWTSKREGHEMDVYEDLIRVPLVFSHPPSLVRAKHASPLRSGQALPAEKVVTQLVRQVDILPTILDLVGATLPAGIHGVSLCPALFADVPLGLAAYIEAFLRLRSDPRNRRVGLRTEEWKYIYAPQNHGLGEELYQLRHDPQEHYNLVSRHREIAATLRRQIEEMQKSFLPVSPAEVMTEEEKARIEKRLSDLGYL